MDPEIKDLDYYTYKLAESEKTLEGLYQSLFETQKELKRINDDITYQIGWNQFLQGKVAEEKEK